MVAADAYCRVIDVNRQAVLLTYRESKSLSREHIEAIKRMEVETNAFISDCLSRCIEDGLIRAIDVELITYYFVMMAHAWALKHWRLGQFHTVDSYIKENIGYMLESLLTGKGRQRYAEVCASFWGEGAAGADVRRHRRRGGNTN